MSFEMMTENSNNVVDIDPASQYVPTLPVSPHLEFISMPGLPFCEKQVNASLLAERVIHKFKKWGPVRFGASEACQKDFYDGSDCIDGPYNPVTFDLVFVNYVKKFAEKEDINYSQILNNLHIGLTGADRFKNFIHVNVPKQEIDDDFDNEENDEHHYEHNSEDWADKKWETDEHHYEHNSDDWKDNQRWDQLILNKDFIAPINNNAKFGNWSLPPGQKWYMPDFVVHHPWADDSEFDSETD